MRFIFTFILASALLVGSFFIFDVLPKSILIDNNIKGITVGQTKFQVEVADTPALQAKGLSGRKALLENQGMLFVFDKPSIPGFWMKDMNFPIDVIWISDGKVVGIQENLVPNDASDRRIYYPSQEITHVLEVAMGVVTKFGIVIGDAFQ